MILTEMSGYWLHAVIAVISYYNMQLYQTTSTCLQDWGRGQLLVTCIMEYLMLEMVVIELRSPLHESRVQVLHEVYIVVRFVNFLLSK